MQTVEQAKLELRANWEAGIKCPCCGQLVKKYSYSLNAGIAEVLIKMYRNGSFAWAWVHVNKEIRPASGGYFSLAKWWGLIEQQSNDDPAKRGSGLWRLTMKGMRFVRSEITLPKYAEIFDQHLLGFSGKEITIREALGTKFNYQDLMNEEQY